MTPNCCHTNENTSKIARKLKLALLVFAAVFAISFLPILQPLNQSFLAYLSIIWWAVLLGLLLGGIIDYFIPSGFIQKYLGKRKISSLFFAVIAGFLLSACSHGILALAIQLYKKGASTSSVITFLMASPWANLPVTLLFFSFFGIKALYFIGAAMLIALITGFIFLFLEKKGLIESSKKSKGTETYRWNNLKNFHLKNAYQGVKKGTIQLANMVLWWIIIGFLAAVIIRAYVPEELFLKYFGPSFTGLLITLAAATVIEICSEGSSPIAFEIFNKVGVLGNPFVFLMAGVATDYTEIGLIWTNIGKKTAIWLPLVAVPQILLVGWLFNVFL